jgi:phosphotransferase system HPr (HPr) family protein
MIKQDLVFNNQLGLHARPAAFLVQFANQFSSEIKLIKDNKEANLKSILGLLWLKVKDKEELTIVAKGSDEEKAVSEVIDLIENRLNVVSYQQESTNIKNAQEKLESVAPSQVVTMLGEGVRKNLKDI